VLLIVPTHDHASTLDLAVRSALEQTHTDLDVVVIGDGVGDDTREVARDLCRSDERVRFLDRPKSSSRGEETRHEVITSSSSSVVTYLGDDDLLLPDHVATMTGLLADHDFAHPFPTMIDTDDRLLSFPTDLSDPRCVAWHLDPRPGHNTVSLTGAAHTTEVYRRLPHGWQAPPPGRWPDHYMWDQFLHLPGIRIATALRTTTIKPPSVLRGHLDPASRRAALQTWWDRMHGPDFRSWWDAEVADALRRRAVETLMGYVSLEERVHELEAELTSLRDDVVSARAELEVIRATRTWKLHDRLAGHALVRRVAARSRPHPPPRS
jgi:glycosyltransferase involved in cell wall biosynthesis